jgi:hypothetical protein
VPGGARAAVIAAPRVGSGPRTASVGPAAPPAPAPRPAHPPPLADAGVARGSGRWGRRKIHPQQRIARVGRRTSAAPPCDEAAGASQTYLRAAVTATQTRRRVPHAHSRGVVHAPQGALARGVGPCPRGAVRPARAGRAPAKPDAVPAGRGRVPGVRPGHVPALVPARAAQGRPEEQDSSRSARRTRRDSARSGHHSGCS